MYCDNVCAIIYVDEISGIVTVDNLRKEPVFQPFSDVTTEVTLEDFYDFLESRCFPRERVNCKQILKGKLYGYEPFSIVKETHGAMADDCFWLRFDDEELTWKDVNIWNKVNKRG